MEAKTQQPETDTGGIKIWDAPVRLFHWLLVALIVFSWWSGEEGGNAMQYHMWSGYAILTLVLFRIVWGLCGSSTARFSAFVKGPAAVIAYVRTLPLRRAGAHVGHNPLGGWSVVMLLVCALVQAATGLFANDDIVTEGPLYRLVSKATSDLLTTVHHINFNILLLLAGVHIAAVLFYLWYKADNLIKPMFTGYRSGAQGAGESPVRHASNWLAVMILAIAAAAVYFLVRK